MATTFKFSDIQNILDAIANKNGSIGNSPHGVFWRQTGNYANDYKLFVTGQVPNVGLPIMDAKTPLNSNFFVILTNPNGLSGPGIPQMPEGGPYVTDAGYSALVNNVTMTGTQIVAAMTSWLNSGFPQ
jgi:hypothetical protein